MSCVSVIRACRVHRAHPQTVHLFRAGGEVRSSAEQHIPMHKRPDAHEVYRWREPVTLHSTKADHLARVTPPARPELLPLPLVHLPMHSLAV